MSKKVKKESEMTTEDTTVLSVENDPDVALIPLDQILADHTWNCRSVFWDENKEYQSLLQSVKTDKAILTAVDVRPASDQELKDTGKPYVLITGFRRFQVCQDLVKAGDLSFARIPARVSDMTAASARLRNIQENTLRENYSIPDLCWGLRDLGDKATQKEIAEKTGLSQTYVGKLINLGKNLLPKIFDQWRACKLNISYNDIKLVSEAPKDQQVLVFEQLLAAAGDKKKGGKGRGAWVETAQKKVSNIGFVIGTLIRKGLVSGVDTSISSWEPDDLKVLCKVPDSAKSDEKESIIEVFLSAVKAGSVNDTEETIPDIDNPPQVTL